MTHTPHPVASGVPYTILDVHSRAPETLDDFAGEATFTVATAFGPQQVSGEGTVAEHAVLFQEKDIDAHGRDVRVWHITRADDAHFTAQHVAVF